MLRDLDEIRAGLENKVAEMRKALPEEPAEFFGGMTLERSTLTENDLARIEQKLGRPISGSFRELLLNFELNGLELGGVLFGDNSREFSTFLLRQIEEPSAYWGSDQPKDNGLILGGTSGYVVFIDPVEGRIWALRRGDDLAQPVARDALAFLRALGSLALEQDVAQEEAYARQIAAEVGATTPAFWLDLARGYG